MLYWQRISIFAGLILLGIASALSSPIDDSQFTEFTPSDTIDRDVCIIGGGSAGTYSAIRLKDEGKSVAIVEATGRLGGHTQTFRDASTGAIDDIGVVVWHNIDLVKNYTTRLNVTIGARSFKPQTNVYADFRTGELIPSHSPSNNTAAFNEYTKQLEKYPSLTQGWFLPDPIPEDLLLSFGDFAKKYSLDAVIPTLFGYGQGVGNALDLPTAFMMKLNSLDVVNSIKAGFVAATHGNDQLYLNAQAELGPDVLFNSRVLATSRNDRDGVKVVVRTPSGRKLIKAKKLLVTIPPKLSNLVGFDLDVRERKIFSQFRNSAYYTGILRNTGIPNNLSLSNIGADTLYNLPVLPAPYGIDPSLITDLYDFKYGSPTEMSDNSVKENILEVLDRLRAAGTLPPYAEKPEFVIFKSHTPFALHVPADAIKRGFYKSLYELQGYSNTYYTGATFQTHDSSLIWRYTENYVLPLILA